MWISLQTTCMQENLRGIKVRSLSDTQWTKRSSRPLKTLAIAFEFAFTAILIFLSRELAWTADVINERDNILGITMHCGKAVIPPLAIPSQNLAQDWAPQILDWGYLVVGTKWGHPQKACIQCYRHQKLFSFFTCVGCSAGFRAFWVITSTTGRGLMPSTLLGICQVCESNIRQTRVSKRS